MIAVRNKSGTILINGEDYIFSIDNDISSAVYGEYDYERYEIIAESKNIRIHMFRGTFDECMDELNKLYVCLGNSSSGHITLGGLY